LIEPHHLGADRLQRSAERDSSHLVPIGVDVAVTNSTARHRGTDHDEFLVTWIGALRSVPILANERARAEAKLIARL
jgi:hypothetical protein